MQLTEHHNEQQFFIRKAGTDAVRVIDRDLQRSFVLAADAIVEDFPAKTVADLDDAAIARVLALQPELVLLGTGARATFPAQAVLAAFLRRGIGLETMDNAAAGRTFNVLVGEGRKAVAVFLLPG